MEQKPNDDILENTEQLLEEISIGQILRDKRQELHISIEEVALYLKIKNRDIEAIEDDEMTKIIKHLYVPGLLRSYAKFLKIDPLLIEDKIHLLHIESNTNNKKHQLLNIGENIGLTPDKHLFLNLSIASILLFFILLSIYNFSENRTPTIKSDSLAEELKKTDF